MRRVTRLMCRVRLFMVRESSHLLAVAEHRPQLSFAHLASVCESNDVLLDLAVVARHDALASLRSRLMLGRRVRLLLSHAIQGFARQLILGVAADARARLTTRSRWWMVMVILFAVIVVLLLAALSGLLVLVAIGVGIHHDPLAATAATTRTDRLLLLRARNGLRSDRRCGGGCSGGGMSCVASCARLWLLVVHRMHAGHLLQLAEADAHLSRLLARQLLHGCDAARVGVSMWRCGGSAATR